MEYTSDIVESLNLPQGEINRFIDPRSGTVSYSGADFKAVVFMPMSYQKADTKLRQLENEIETYSTEYNQIQALRDTLTADYNSAIEGENPFRAAEVRKDLNKMDLLYEKQLLIEIEALTDEHRRLRGIFRSSDVGSTFIRPIVLADVQTVSYSSHRVKTPVRTLGRVSPKSYTRGPRTIAGSMIFTLFYKHAFYDLLEASCGFYNTGVFEGGSDSGYPELSTVLVDQLPPFDITFIAANEVGNVSYMTLYGVELHNEGFTVSIQDIITEDVMQYTARDMDPLRPLKARRNRLQLGESVLTADNLLDQERDELAARRKRLNPFI